MSKKLNERWNSSFIRWSFGAVLVFALFGFGTEDSLYAQPRVLEISVIDSNDKPLADADVEIREWTGELKPTDFRGTTNADGKIVFEDFEMQSYLYLFVRHPEFAPAVMAFSTTENDTLKATVRLARPGTNFLQILSPDGNPVVGAEVTRMEYSSNLTQTKSFANQSLFQAMMQNDGSAYHSDQQGRLQLPPLPMDAVLTVTVTHPDWAVGKIENVKLGEIHNTSLKMAEGTVVEAYFSGSPEAVNKLKGQSIDIVTSDREKNRLMHSFQVKESKTQFTLVPGRYDSLNIRAKDVVITPSLPSSSKLAEFWNIPELDRVKKNFVVRELYPVTGKVVTHDGRPVSNAEIMIGFENLYLDENGNEQIVKEHPSSNDFAETNQDGVFQAKLPKGKTSISIFWTSGYYSIPEELEFEFNGEPNLPNYVVKQKPTLKGQLVDENDQPVPKAVIRFLNNDIDSPCSFTDTKGLFSIDVNALGYDYQKEERSFLLDVAAFDLSSNLCCIQQVDVSDESAVSNCRLRLTSQPATWLMDEIKRRKKERFERVLASSNYLREEIAKAQKKQVSETAKEDLAPEISPGTWLNTEARSLKEFRGKYVLLDFWFIGCGPCERGIPNLKLVHEVFHNQNFSVIGVHIAGGSPEIVKQFADAKGMSYPLVIDAIDEPILKAYRPLGVEGYPTYILIDPAGKIVKDSGFHGSMLECLREKMLLSKETKSSN